MDPFYEEVSLSIIWVIRKFHLPLWKNHASQAYQGKIVYESLWCNTNVSNDTWQLLIISIHFTTEHLPTVAEADDRRDFPQVPQAPHLLALDDESAACKNKNVTPLSKNLVLKRQEETQRTYQATKSGITWNSNSCAQKKQKHSSHHLFLEEP